MAKGKVRYTGLEDFSRMLTVTTDRFFKVNVAIYRANEAYRMLQDYIKTIVPDMQINFNIDDSTPENIEKFIMQFSREAKMIIAKRIINESNRKHRKCDINRFLPWIAMVLCAIGAFLFWKI
jgi:hypothetical protein